MGDFQLQYDAALDMARQHDAIADDVDGQASGLVTSLDGGEGSEFILNALAALGTAAGELSQVNASAAQVLRRTVDVNRGIDEGVEQDFRDLEEEIP
ncbi:MAG: hypothetical protein ACRCZD_08815 [Phycicoccus sp.]